MKPDNCKSGLCTKLFNSRPDTGDVNFVVGKEGQVSSRIPAHKLIMAQASDVFQAMFYGHFETGSDVDLSGDSEIVPEIFEEFLKWVYLGELELTAENAWRFLHLAKKYMIDDLTKFCAASIERHAKTLVPDSRYNCNLFSLVPHLGKHEEIDAIFWDYVSKNAKEVLTSSDFLSLSLDEMAAVVARDSLGIREVDVYHAVIAWATAALTRENEEVGRETIRELLGDVFYEVRFKQMHKDEFGDLLTTTDYLFDNEKQLFSHDVSEEIVALFESSPRTGDVPEYVPPRQAEPSPPLPGYHRYIETKQGDDPDPYLEPNNTIYLGNLPYNLTKEQFDDEVMAELNAALTEEHQLPMDEFVTQYKLFPSRGFAFIEFRSSEEPRRAVDALDGAEYRNRTLNCDFHKHRSSFVLRSVAVFATVKEAKKT